MDVLTIFHLLGLMLVAGGVVGGTVALASVAPAARQKGGGARGPARVHARISVAGLALLWPTGLALLFTAKGLALDTMFWMKLAFAVALTAAVAGIEMAYTRVKSGDRRAAGLLASLAPLAALSLVIGVAFSVLASR